MIQIPESLWLDLIREHLLDLPDPDRERRIQEALLDKLDALARRSAYGKSKTAATPEEREAARQQYLDMVGVPEAFRYPPSP